MDNQDKKIETNEFFDKNLDFNHSCCTIHYEACELCKTARVCSLDINRDLSRLLRVKATLRNCCIGKEVSVACIIFDNCNKILAFKTKTFIVKKQDCVLPENEKDCSCSCCSNACTDVEKLFTFVLPVHDVCSPLTVKAKIIANYTSVQCN